ncbi:MAG: HAD-IB family hydrolase [Alphaproteobacteria bacterium]|nr:MAG: HAD-IB family hydrolase [Alphaproteobacteria bacterium]
MARLVVFDLDRTIVRFGTYTPFLIRFARRHAPWRLLFAPFVLLAMLGYKLGLTTRSRLKEIMFRLLAGRPTVETMMQAADDFADEVLSRHCFQDAVSAIADHRAAGDTLVLATASFSFYAARIGKRLGFDHTVGTDIAEGGGRFLPRIVGDNCYGPAKERMVTRYLDSRGLGRDFIFYTDDKSDIPLLNRAGAGILVNPKKPLAAYGATRPNMRAVAWQ